MDQVVGKKKKSSIVWRFFEKPVENPEKVKCPSCSDLVVYKGTTSGILSHLIRKHKQDYRKLEERFEKENTEENANLSNTDAQSLLAQSFCSGLIPFRFSENPEFLKFLNVVAPNFKSPSAAKIKLLIEKGTEDHMHFLKKSFKSVDKYTIITDGYSDLKINIHVYSLHVSFVDDKMDRKTLFVALRSVYGGDNVAIATVLSDMLNDVGLRMSRCSSLCSDAASPLTLMADKHGFDRIHCGCHMLNLIIGDFADEKTVKKQFMHVTNFARYLSRHKEDKNKLAALAKKNGIPCSIPLPLPATRWGALHILFNQYLGVYDSAKDLSNLKQFLVRSSELESIRNMCNLVKPIHECILRLEKDTSTTSEIVPALVFVKERTENNDSSLARKLLALVKGRLETCHNNIRLMCSMLVDHRFAYDTRYMDDSEWKLVEIDLARYNTADNDDNLDNTDEPMDDDFESFLTSGCDKPNKKSRFETELLNYRAMISSNRPSIKSPFDFWKSQKSNFPKLATVASILLATPGSSATSERTFSRCTDLIRQIKRNRMSVDTINCILTVSELASLRRSERQMEENSDSDSDDEASDDDSVSFQPQYTAQEIDDMFEEL